MQRHRHRNDGDLWEPYEGLYQTPTERERQMIEPFLFKYEFEDDGFVEEDNEYWVQLKEILQRPNLRGELMDFLHKVRESKGYDVDRCFGFFQSPFLALRLDSESVYDDAKAATDAAIEEINQSGNGKRYQFVSLERYNRVRMKLLLTFTVIETDSDTMEFETDSTAMETDDDPNADRCLKTIQAMVEEPKNMVFHLLEWKFKPPPAIPFRVPYCIKF